MKERVEWEDVQGIVLSGYGELLRFGLPAVALPARRSPAQEEVAFRPRDAADAIPPGAKQQYAARHEIWP